MGGVGGVEGGGRELSGGGGVGVGNRLSQSEVVYREECL